MRTEKELALVELIELIALEPEPETRGLEQIQVCNSESCYCYMF